MLDKVIVEAKISSVRFPVHQDVEIKTLFRSFKIILPFRDVPMTISLPACAARFRFAWMSARVECIVPGKPQEEWLGFTSTGHLHRLRACIPSVLFEAIFPEDEVPQPTTA